MIPKLLRFFFVLAVLAVTYLALTPGPLGNIIESGETRHMLAFGVLPLLSSFAWPRIGPVRQFLAFAAFGGAIEIAQLLMNVGRAAEWGDWGFDLLATLLALTLATLLKAAAARLATH